MMVVLLLCEEFRSAHTVLRFRSRISLLSCQRLSDSGLYYTHHGADDFGPTELLCTLDVYPRAEATKQIVLDDLVSRVQLGPLKRQS